MSRQPASSTVATPSSAAFFAFDPASAPSTTKSVFFDTLSVTRAPRASARALASGRVMVVSEPVNTMDLPESGPSAVAFSGCTSSSAARSSKTARLRGSAKKPTSSSAMAPPTRMMLPSACRSSEPTIVAATIWSRQCASVP